MKISMSLVDPSASLNDDGSVYLPMSHLVKRYVDLRKASQWYCIPCSACMRPRRRFHLALSLLRDKQSAAARSGFVIPPPPPRRLASYFPTASRQDSCTAMLSLSLLPRSQWKSEPFVVRMTDLMLPRPSCSLVSCPPPG